MKLSIVTAFLAAGVAFSSNAATLIPMKGVSLLYINGQEADSKIKPNEIGIGLTQVVLRMDKKIGKGSSQNVYTSAPYVLTFNVTGDEVKINHPLARSKQEAEAAFRVSSPQWRVVQDSVNLPYEQEKLKGREGFLPYMNIEELVAEYNQKNGVKFDSGNMVVAAVATAPVVSNSELITQSSKKAEVKPLSVKSSNIEQLKAWYLKASKEERKEFRKWMIDQE
ncbi:YccT family protein [Vibrio sp. ER1A]|uniref:YccT family protein n=1 Tax=Vibrio sp. ER1A TaxID=1517681 RepID=UPI0004DCC84B|nr:DUF2057 domain-containing protein [Vibrio sp. ER1A]KFA98963.1 hypothetical protein HW45_08100 [Vibrio sp. ER1A]